VSRRAAVAWHKRNISRKIQTHENCGSLRKLTVAGRKMMTRHTRVAWCKRGVIRKKLDQGQNYVRNTESKDAPGKQNGRKGSRRQMAAIFDEGKDINHKWHWSVEIRTAITSGKWKNAHECPI
jgi:hypothetical protein